MNFFYYENFDLEINNTGIIYFRKGAKISELFLEHEKFLETFFGGLKTLRKPNLLIHKGLNTKISFEIEGAYYNRNSELLKKMSLEGWDTN